MENINANVRVLRSEWKEISPYIISAFLSTKAIRRKIYCQTVSEKKNKKVLYMPGELHISKSAYPEGWDHLH